MVHNSISLSEWYSLLFGTIPSTAGAQGEIEGVVRGGEILLAIQILLQNGPERLSGTEKDTD